MATTSRSPMEERRIAMTYEEWLRWAGESQQSEWVDGEAIAFVPPTIRHADLALFLSILLSLFVQRHRLGKVLAAPFEVRLSAKSSREPDLGFISTANAERIGEKRIDGAPDLVVEIVSDDSTRRDRVAKREEYAAAGVAEYWILDPRPRRVAEEFLVLGADGRYQPVVLGPDGWYRSRIIAGFRLWPQWLRADPLPDPLACLAEIVSETA
ncbi:MAG: Uma2 family endonuclease [Chloroflexia bacterium]|nr:Uma2 family endonuclease [Chloroflexia bacterium]